MDTNTMRTCSALLPPPGDETVNECLDEIDRLREENKALRRHYFAVTGEVYGDAPAAA